MKTFSWSGLIRVHAQMTNIRAENETDARKTVDELITSLALQEQDTGAAIPQYTIILDPVPPGPMDESSAENQLWLPATEILPRVPE